MGKEQSKEKRHYRLQECPFCHKLLRNVKNHILQKHQAESGEGQTVLSKEDLLGSREKPKDEEIVYHCNNCQAKLRKGENPCWQCGAQLIWDGLE